MREPALITEADMSRAMADGAAAFHERHASNPYRHPLMRWAWDLGWRLAVALEDVRTEQKQRDASWFKFRQGASGAAG
jgi:hypothetical protein